MIVQRIRGIWSGLVEFVNADLEQGQSAIRLFAKTVLEAMPPAARQVVIGEWRTELDCLLFPDSDLAELPPELASQVQKHRHEFIRKAKEYQPQLRILLSYLYYQPKYDQNDPAVADACDFLWKHETHVSFAKIPDQQADSLPDADMSRARFQRIAKRKRLYPLRNVARYEDMVDPICKFIADQLEAYYDGQTKQLVPIVICGREGCGKFLMPKRVGRKMYCDDCKDKHHNDERQTETADRKWLYRLRDDGLKNSALLRMKLKTPEIRERFDGLKKKRTFAKLAAKVESLVASAKT
jgi:hypothetical protein